MSVYLLLPLLAFIINTILAPIVLWGHARQPAQRTFALFLVSMALWGGTIFLMRSSASLEAALFWDRLAFVNFYLIAVFYLHFTYLFAETRVSRPVLLTIYGLIPVVAALAFTNLLVQGMQVKFYGNAPIPGSLFPAYLVLVYSCILLGLRNLVSVYRRPTSQAQRNRAGYLVTATAFSVVGGTTDFLPLLGLAIYPLGIVGNILFATLATLTITRHRLLDIQVALRRAVGYLVVITLASGLYLVIALVLHQVLRLNLLTASFAAIGIGLATLGCLLFLPAVRNIHNWIDRLFNWKRWGPLQELHQFTTETKNIDDLHDLAQSLVHLVKRAMAADVVVLLQSNRNNQAPWSSVSEGVGTQVPVPLKDNSAWLRRLAGEDRAYLAEELYARPEWQEAPDPVRRHIEGLDIKVFLPLHHKEELTGLLLLGAKSSRRGYTLEELDLLEAVALHAAATMANARLYEDLRLQLQELKETQAQLVQSGKLASVGTLAAGVAHEVNNPIFAITGMAEILLSNPQRHLKSDQAQECLSVIAEMANRIAAVVQGMLVYARNDNLAMAVSLNEVADATLRLMEHKLRSGGVEVVRDYRPNLPYVLAVSNRLQQALMNLILNASDAMGKSGTLTLSTGADDSRAWISCRDTGSGISRQDLDRIFDAFFTTKPVGKGTGLGLHITHRIVEECGGEIRVESEEGMGATFTICLPIAPLEDEDADVEFYDQLPHQEAPSQLTPELHSRPHQVAAGRERESTK